MEPNREPKWSPRGSQDGAKKEKKSEVKLREVKSQLFDANKRETVLTIGIQSVLDQK